MEKILWDSSFSVGIAKLDEQHKRLIGMLNLLIGDPEADVHSETVSEILTRMTKYATEHFQTEEQLLAEYGYSGLAAQKQTHKEFQEKAVTLCIETMQERTSVPADILEYLKRWLTQHILVMDMQYRSYLNERGVR